MEQLIKKVYDTFSANQAIFIEKGFTPVSTIDRWRGQTIHPNDFEMYPLPAMFIEYKITWKKTGKQYEGKVHLGFHVITNEPWGGSSISSNVDEALKDVFYYKACQALLDDLASDCNGKLYRTGEHPVDTGVICYQVLDYEGNYYDVANTFNLVPVPDATVQVAGQLVKHL